MDIFKKKIAFIGAGNMAEAIIAGIIKSNLLNPNNIYISDIDEKRLDFLKNKFNINTSKNNFNAFEKSNLLFLSIKPQFIEQAIDEITSNQNYKKVPTEKKIILSIVAGVKTSKIKTLFKAKKNLSFIRVMPNTPALVSAGISGFYADETISSKDIEIVKTVLETFGKSIFFENEKMIDAVTAISGSGPAYFFYFFETLIDAAKNIGLEELEAKILVKETIKGSLKLLEETQIDAKILRKNVTSKNGTTEAALKTLKKQNFQKAIMDAVASAHNRSQEISNSS